MVPDFAIPITQTRPKRDAGVPLKAVVAVVAVDPWPNSPRLETRTPTYAAGC